MSLQTLVCPNDLGGGENTTRLARMFARFISVGYLVYLAMLLPSISMLAPLMSWWWTPVSVALVFGTGLLPGALSFRSNPKPMRVSSGIAAVMFLVVAASWPVAWNGPHIGDDDGVWLAFFPGVASIAAVIVWPTLLVFGHLVIGCVVVQVINYVARGETEVAMIAPGDHVRDHVLHPVRRWRSDGNANREATRFHHRDNTCRGRGGRSRARSHGRTREVRRPHPRQRDVDVPDRFRGQPQDIVGAMATTALTELDNIRTEAVPD